MRNPWIAVMRAAAIGRGLHLSADEVALLARDRAIEACADNDCDNVGIIPSDWSKVDPYKVPPKAP